MLRRRSSEEDEDSEETGAGSKRTSALPTPTMITASQSVPNGLTLAAAESQESVGSFKKRSKSKLQKLKNRLSTHFECFSKFTFVCLLCCRCDSLCSLTALTHGQQPSMAREAQNVEIISFTALDDVQLDMVNGNDLSQQQQQRQHTESVDNNDGDDDDNNQTQVPANDTHDCDDSEPSTSTGLAGDDSGGSGGFRVNRTVSWFANLTNCDADGADKTFHATLPVTEEETGETPEDANTAHEPNVVQIEPPKPPPRSTSFYHLQKLRQQWQQHQQQQQQPELNEDSLVPTPEAQIPPTPPTSSNKNGTISNLTQSPNAAAAEEKETISAVVIMRNLLRKGRKKERPKSDIFQLSRTSQANVMHEMFHPIGRQAAGGGTGGEPNGEASMVGAGRQALRPLSLYGDVTTKGLSRFSAYELSVSFARCCVVAN